MFRTPCAFFQHNGINAAYSQFCGKPQAHWPRPDYNGISSHHEGHSARICQKSADIPLIPLRVVLRSHLVSRSPTRPPPAPVIVPVVPALAAEQHEHPAAALVSANPGPLGRRGGPGRRPHPPLAAPWLLPPGGRRAGG